MEIKILVLLIINLLLVTLIFFLFKKNLTKKLKQEQDTLERMKYLEESIWEISKATLQYQVELSEAVIRIKKLLDLIDIPESIRYRMDPINKMYLEISKFSILDERKKLSSKVIFEQDQERYKIEDFYKDQVFICLSELNMFFKHKFKNDEK